MSAVEAEAKPIISELIGGHARLLPRAEQSIVAKWLALKGAIQMRSRYGEAFSDTWVQAVRELEQAPPSWQIRIGKAETGDELWFGANTLTINVRFPLAPFPINYDGFLTTVSIGHFIGQVIGANRFVETVRTNPRYLIPIWPARDGAIDWPPPSNITNQQIRLMLSDSSEPR